MTDSFDVTYPVRAPLNLPRGSVRALLALSIFGSTMGLLAMGKVVEQGLWLINYVMLGYYFASRSGSPTTAPVPTSQPLGLPRGTVRWLLILAFVGTAGYLGWKWYGAGKDFWKHPAFFPMLSLSSFFFGRLVKVILDPLLDNQGPRSTFAMRLQDGKALLVLLCALAVILLCFVGLTFPGSSGIKNFSFTFVLFYYGSR
jgi:hypothetical protein